MPPLPRRPPRPQLLNQPLPHPPHPPTHPQQILLPLLIQRRVPQHPRHHPRSERRRRRYLRPLQPLQLARDARGDGCGMRDDVQRADALAVEPEVLGEGLRDAEFEERPAEEVPDGPGVGG